MSVCRRDNKKPLTGHFLSRANVLIRGATLIHGLNRALSRIPSYPRQVTSAFNVAEYSAFFCL